MFWILIRYIRIPGSSLNPNSYPDSAFFCTLPAILNSFYTTAELFLKNGWLKKNILVLCQKEPIERYSLKLRNTHRYLIFLNVFFGNWIRIRIQNTDSYIHRRPSNTDPDHCLQGQSWMEAFKRWQMWPKCDKEVTTCHKEMMTKQYKNKVMDNLFLDIIAPNMKYNQSWAFLPWFISIAVHAILSFLPHSVSFFFSVSACANWMLI